MTRDEAVQKLRAAQPKIDTVWNAALWVDAFVALGMLKLDDPKSVDQRLDLVLSYLGPAATHVELKYALEAQGLALIEKQGTP
jgi:hypothetical protein